MTAIEQSLKDKNIRVELRDGGLAFIPKSNMDDSIREVIAAEGKGLYKVALEIRDRLQVLGKEAQEKPAAWKRLHYQLTAKWSHADPAYWDAYGDLISWVAAWLMRVIALSALEHPLLDAVTEGRKADLSFTARWIPNAERRLISTSILWPEIRKKVMNITMSSKQSIDKSHALSNQDRKTATQYRLLPREADQP